MAISRIKGITIEIGGDTTKLQTALRDVNSTIRSTQAQLKDVEKLLKLDPGNTELLAQKHRLLGDSVNATREKLETLKTAADFDSGMSRVASISGAAGEELDSGTRPGRWAARRSSVPVKQPPPWSTWPWLAGRRRRCWAALRAL